MDEAIARRGQPERRSRRRRRRATTRPRSGCIGRYIDEQKPRDVFFFEQDGAFVVRLFMTGAQAGSHHILAEFTRDDIDGARRPQGPSPAARRPGPNDPAHAPRQRSIASHTEEHAMKALKTVAVALGITLAALIVIPLVVLAGLFVWLKLTEEADEEIARARPGRRLIDKPVPATDAAPGRRAPTSSDARRIRRGAGTSAARAAGASRRATPDRRLAELGVLGVMVLWAGNFIVVKAALAVLPPVGFTFLRFASRRSTLLLAPALARGLDPAAARATSCRSSLLGALGFGIYQILWTTGLADDAGRRLGAAHRRRRPSSRRSLAVVDRRRHADAGQARSARLVSFVGRRRSSSRPATGLDLGGSPRRRRCSPLAAASAGRSTSRSGRGILRRHSPLRTTAWAMVAGTLVLAPIGLGQLVDAPTCRRRRPGADRARVLYSGSPVAGGRQRRRLPAASQLLGPTRVTALQFLVAGAGRRPRGDLPGRADPARPGRRRRRHRRRGRSLDAGGPAAAARSRRSSRLTPAGRSAPGRPPSRRCVPARRRWRSSSTTTARSR